MRFADIVDWCAARLDDGAVALDAAGAGRPHVYRWWEPGMADPAAYLWMEPVPATEAVDWCTTRDDTRMVLAFTVNPSSGEGEDMLTVEQIVDAVVPVVDAALPELARLTQRRPSRQGFRVVRDETTGEGSPRPLVVEVPLVIPWFHDNPPA